MRRECRGLRGTMAVDNTTFVAGVSLGGCLAVGGYLLGMAVSRKPSTPAAVSRVLTRRNPTTIAPTLAR